MPSDKGNSWGRRLKQRGGKVIGQKPTDSEANDSVEIQVPREQPRVIHPAVEPSMAATRHPERRRPGRRHRTARRHSVLRIWAFRIFLLIILFVWALFLLGCFKFGLSESVSPSEILLWNSEVNGRPLGKSSAWERLHGFLFPITCMVKENQEVKACSDQLNLTKTECLRSKCCFSPSRTPNCFVPLRDKSTQIIRIFGLSVLSLIILGWLPICCCHLCQRSGLGNPLRRRNNDRMLRNLKKERKKLKDSTEMVEATREDEDGDEEKEARALLSR